MDELTINLRKSERKQALACIGVESLRQDFKTEAQRRHVLIEAHLAWGNYDVDEHEIVQLGTVQSEFGKPVKDPDVILRANASLYLYAKRKMLKLL